MNRNRDRKQRRNWIKRRYRHTVHGTAERPRLAVYHSLRHVYAQVIDDDKGVTIASASTLEKPITGELDSTGNVKAAAIVGRIVAERAKEHGVDKVVFDRGGFPYHGVVRSVAEAARGAGLKF